MSYLKNSVPIILSSILVLAVGWLLFGWLRPHSQTQITATTVVRELQELQRLETTVFTMEQIVEADVAAEQAVWRRVLFGDRLLLIAHGQVVAGIDLSQLAAEDIVVADQRVELTLPAAQIFSASLDESKTRVYDRQRGLLNRGDVDLESEARESAVALLESAACEAGILETASQNAQHQLTAFLQALEFSEVDVTVKPGSCQ